MRKEEIKDLWFNIKHYGTIINILDQETEHGFYTYKHFIYDQERYVSMERNGVLLSLNNCSEDELIYDITEENKNE